jgi:peptidoglycan/LPS O-acetylase OafA/YrhL
LFVIIGPIWRLTHQDDEAGFLYAYLACFDGIAIGCCAALLSKHLPATRSGTAGLQVAVAGAMAFLYLYRPISETNVYGVTLMAFSTAVLLIAAQRQPATGSRFLEPLRRCGRLSYELYLFHLTVLGGLQIVSPPYGTSFPMITVPLAANIPPTPWQTEIFAPGTWAGATPRIWRTLSWSAYIPYMPECM